MSSYRTNRNCRILIVLEYKQSTNPWVILCQLPEKGRREIVEEREGPGRKRKMSDSEQEMRGTGKKEEQE